MTYKAGNSHFLSVDRVFSLRIVRTDDVNGLKKSNISYTNNDLDITGTTLPFDTAFATIIK